MQLYKAIQLFKKQPRLIDSEQVASAVKRDIIVVIFSGAHEGGYRSLDIDIHIVSTQHI